MDVLKLRFAATAQADLELGPGMHGIGRAADGLGPAADESAMVRFCVDRRGVWLAVNDGAPGVHVNGREIRRLAMLRVGDTVYVDGVEMRLVCERSPRPLGPLPDPVPLAETDPRIVLRGIGGRHHGRSFTLDRPRLVGRANGADIRIDDPAFPERHARVELGPDGVLLRDLGSGEGSMVNGESVRDALLRPGDQVVFDAHHRFVVEAPMREGAHERAFAMGDALQDPQSPPRAVAGGGTRPWRLPWLLLAALALACLLSLLLLYGVG